MNKKASPFFLLTLGTVALGAAFWLFIKTSPPKEVAKKTLLVYGEVPDFHLTTQSNEAFSLENLKGKIWIGDFIFTRCAGICPLMSQRMAQLQKQIHDPNIHFVSFSVDPERDTPEVLTEYAKRYQADLATWTFLTGSKDEIFKLSEQHFHLGVASIPSEYRTLPDQSVQHSSKLVLVDSSGKIRGYYDTDEAAALSQLIQDVSLLAKSH